MLFLFSFSIYLFVCFLIIHCVQLVLPEYLWWWAILWNPGDLPGTTSVEWSSRKLSTALSYAPQWNVNCPDLVRMTRVCKWVRESSGSSLVQKTLLHSLTSDLPPWPLTLTIFLPPLLQLFQSLEGRGITEMLHLWLGKQIIFNLIKDSFDFRNWLKMSKKDFIFFFETRERLLLNYSSLPWTHSVALTAPEL